MKDVVEQKKVTQITARGKPATRYAFRLRTLDDWASTLDEGIGESLQEGDEIEVETYSQGGFINIKSAEVIVSGDKPADTGIKPGSAQKSPPRKTNGKRWHAYEDKEYQQAKDELIVRQMAYKASVNSFDNFVAGTVEEEKLRDYHESLLRLAHLIYEDIIGGKW